MMDTPRRWQVASLATAVAGLGVGGMLLGRPAVDTVQTIDLDHVTGPVGITRDQGAQTAVPGAPQIVEPEAAGEGDVDAATAKAETTTADASIATPDEPDGSGTTTSGTQGPSGSTTRSTAPADQTAADDGADSPDSVDSDDSLDS